MTLEDALRTIVREEMARAVEDLKRATRPPTNETPPASPDDVLTAEEAAHEAKCSPRTIAAACKSGALEGHKPPGLNEWRITRGALLLWVRSDGQRTETPDSPLDIEAKGRNAANRLLGASGADRRHA